MEWLTVSSITLPQYGAVGFVLVLLGRTIYLQTRLRRTQREVYELTSQRDIAVTQTERFSIIEQELTTAHDTIDSLHQQVQDLRIDLACEQQKQEYLEQVQQLVEQRDGELADIRQQLSDKNSQVAELTTRLEEQRQQSDEKIHLLNDARATLSQQFKTLAQEIFDEKGRRFSEHSGEQLHQMLNPFREQLQEFKKKVDDVYVNDVRERASLRQEIDNLHQLNMQMTSEAVNLTRALKGDKKVQGNWGELVLERVLEQSGLRAGMEYDAQGAFRNADSRLLRPDVIVHLPENKDVVIDSKVSLIAYERYCNENDADLQAQALQHHVQAVRQHITTLSDKDYTSLKGVHSLDFVLMFMPIEAAFMAAFQADDALFNHAFERRIVVVSPTTLLATLRTIENIWRYERQNENTQAIAERAGAVYDKLRGFVEDMEKLGVQLATIDSTYTAAMTKLTQGRGNLISQASRFVDLGVKVRKTIPKTVLERSELETDIGRDVYEK
ncbi:MAG: DNA recombination protein RmuC [Thermodesulfobacteriota bacterium]|nr:DNA recombination protein RmuC [Thermodesulfobacteriota bacterium]